MLARFKHLASIMIRPTPQLDQEEDCKSATGPSIHSATVKNESMSEAIMGNEFTFMQRKHVVDDEQIQNPALLRSIFKTCRKMWQTDGSVDTIVSTLSVEICDLLTCGFARVFLKRDGGLYCADLTKAASLVGIVGHVYSTGDPIRLSSSTEIASFPGFVHWIDSCRQKRVPKSLLCVPLFSTFRGQSAIVGVIQALNKHDSAFTNEDVHVAMLLGDYVGQLVLSGKQIEMTTQLVMEGIQQHARSTALLQVARALSSETTINGIVSLITRKVQNLLSVERCTMFLVDRESNELIVWRDGSHGVKLSFLQWIKGYKPAPSLPFLSNENEMRMPMGKGIAGYVVSTGEKLKVDNAYSDSRFNPEMDRQTGFLSRNILCMPLKTSKGEIVGAIQAINKDPSKDGFNEADEGLLEVFAAHTAIAIQNSSLIQVMKKNLDQSDAILEVTNALSRELKLNPLVKVIVQKIHSLLNVERCTVFICDHARQQLYTTSSMSYGDGISLPIQNETEDIIRIPMNAGIAGHVAMTGETLCIVNAYNDARFSPKMDQETGYRTRNILCMSIQNHRSEIVGVVQVINKRNRLSFTNEDVKQLGAFSAQAAVAISNSRLFQETERALNHALRQVRNLKFMLRVTKNLSSELQTSNLMTQMQTQLNDLLKADHCFFFVVDLDKSTFCRLDFGVESEPYSLERGISGWVATNGKPVKIQSQAFQDQRFDGEVDTNDHPCQSILCMPIIAQTEENEKMVIGMISVQDEADRGGFGKEEELLLKVFCAQASVALVNSKQFLRVIEDATRKQDDISATDYLTQDRGMQLGSHEIDRFEYSVDEINLIRAIGNGSYGEVWLARARNEIVAVKKLFTRCLKGEQIDAFCSEASLMCQLKHRNVVAFKGAITQPPDLCIVTEYCSRGSLADLLMDQGFQMTNRIVMDFVKDIAAGMHYLHTSNPVILHRDLKSDNLLVDENWVVKVADFGLTRFLDEKEDDPGWNPDLDEPRSMYRREIHRKGKTPELWTYTADVYAFGIIIWEILTRHEPYKDKETMQIVVEVVNNGMRPFVTEGLRSNPFFPLMTDCWHQVPDRRPNFKTILERLRSPEIVLAMDNDGLVQN